MAADLRARFASRREGATLRPGCPDAMEVWSAVAAETAPDRLAEILDHTVVCPACAAAWRLARELGAAKEGSVSRDQRPARSAWLPLAAAAALLLAAGLTLQRLPGWRPAGSAQSPLRATPSVTIESLLGAERACPREACVLEWSEVSAGARYVVRIMDADLNLIDRAVALETTSYRVPAERLASISSGAVLHWQVEAMLADGGRTVSPTFAIRLE